jgi:Putative zincin peptidase
MRAYEWKPGRGVLLLWMLLALPLTLAGFVLFGGALALRQGGEATISVGGDELHLLALPIVALALLALLHEAVHGLTMRAFGVRPHYYAGTFRKLMPYLACTAPRHGFTKAQYIAITLAPALAISSLGVMWMLVGPGAEFLVLPFALHLAGCIGDFWMAALTLLAPTGARIEDTGTGLRVHTSV